MKSKQNNKQANKPNPIIPKTEAPKTKPAQEIKPVIIEDESIKKRRITLLITLCSIIAVGLISSLIYHSWLAHHGKDFYPYNSFLFRPDDRYNDFYNIYHASADLNPYLYAVSNYFPFAFSVMYLFTLIPANASFVLFTVMYLVFLFGFFFKKLRLESTLHKSITALIIVGLSYPMWSLFERGNNEAWLIMCSIMFVMLYMKGKDIPAMIFLSMAIAFKLYPIVLILLLVIDKKYLLIVYTGITTGLLTLFSAGMLDGGIKETFEKLVNIFTKDSSVLTGGTQAMQHNTSLYVPVKMFYYNMLTKMPVTPPHFVYEAAINKYYVIIAMSIFAICAFVLLRYQFEFWKKIAIMVMLFVMLPQISADYKVPHLFLPLLLFINSDLRSKTSIIYCILFGLILIPKDYGIIANDLSIAPLINPLIILSIITLIIIEAIASGKTIEIKSYFTFNRNLQA